MREIGSEFWSVPVQKRDSGLFPESTSWFLSGRSALRAILEDLKGVKDAAIPSWCCDSMIKPFVDAGVEVHFYPVYWDGRLRREPDLNRDVLLDVDYFGRDAARSDLSGYGGVVIRDATHSLFSKPRDEADYVFGSLRKWCGVWSGGFAWTKDGRRLNTGEFSDDDLKYLELRKEGMREKSRYIETGDGDKGYLGILGRAEELLENTGIAPAAPRDVELARKLDVATIRDVRIRNAKILRDAFRDRLILPELAPEACPLFAPIFVPDGKRDSLRRRLIERDIYCPVHWPISEYHRLDEKTETLYRSELSLVCDQRYDENDMDRIVETAKEICAKI